MFKVVNVVPRNENIVELDNLHERDLAGNIVMAEKGEIQDILIYVRQGYSSYQWSSLYCRDRIRNSYNTIKEAIQSRLDKGMSVYLCQNRGEFRSLIKYNGVRS